MCTGLFNFYSYFTDFCAFTEVTLGIPFVLSAVFKAAGLHLSFLDLSKAATFLFLKPNFWNPFLSSDIYLFLPAEPDEKLRTQSRWWKSSWVHPWARDRSLAQYMQHRRSRGSGLSGNIVENLYMHTVGKPRCTAWRTSRLRGFCGDFDVFVSAFTL